MYIHIHWHSHYSLLESIGKVGKIIDKAKEYGYPAIGITDYNGMYGIMEFYTKAKKAELKAICGIELMVTHQLGKKPDQDQYVVLIAKTYEWYQNLMKLTTIASTKGMAAVPTTDFTTLEQHAKGLICVLGGPRGLLHGLQMNGHDMTKIDEQIRWFKKVFSPDLYLEVIAQDYMLESSLKPINDQIIAWAEQHELPVIASTNFHYIAAKDKKAFEVAMAIKDQRQLTDPARRRIQGDYYIMKEEQVRDILLKNGYTDNQIQVWFDTNQNLCDSVDLVMPKWTAKFPTYKSPEDMVILYEKVKNNLVQ